MNSLNHNKIPFLKYIFLIFSPLCIGLFINEIFRLISLYFISLNISFKFLNIDFGLTEVLITFINLIILLLIFFKFIFFLEKNIKRNLLIVYTFVNLIFTGICSYFFFSLDGFSNFSEIKFLAEKGLYSDISGMVRLINIASNINYKFSVIEIFFDSDFYAAYNNYLSPFKIYFSIKSLPAFGLYGLAIYASWFQIIFFVILLNFINLQYFQTKHNIFLFLILIFIIAPFGLPNDREALIFPVIALCSICLINFNYSKLSELVKILFCFLIFYFHRPSYFPLLFFLLVLILFFNLNWFRLHLSENKKLYIILSIIFLLIFLFSFNQIIKLTSPIIPNQYLYFLVGKQDLWNNIYNTFPNLFYLIKFLFLVLTPFPYFQIFKDTTSGWSFIVPPRLVSLNIIPIFMFGKLFIFILALKKILEFNKKYIILVVFSICFFMSVVISMRSGQYYLLPSYVFLVIWILFNKISLSDILTSLKFYIFVVFASHFLYIYAYK